MQRWQSIANEAARVARSGRLDEAAARYERLLADHPDLPDVWYELGVLQRRLGRFDAALASYQQALDRGVARPEEVHLNRGVIYSDCLRRDEAAAVELESALRLNPRYVPALLNLANLQEDLGQLEAASRLYEQALSVDPRSALALARYSGLRPIAGPDDPLLARLRSAANAATTSLADKALLGFALGAALDRIGLYPPAFEAYTAANAASRLSAPPDRASYDRLHQERLVDQLIRVFDRAGTPKTATPATGTPIFICGMFRSGSTLVEHMLARHPRVTAGGELGLIPALAQALHPYPSSMSGLTASAAERLATQYRSTVSRLYCGAEIVTDKRPDNFLHLGLIMKLFPEARIVHTVRHPLDVCLSNYFLHLDHGMPYALDLLDTGHYYREYRKLMAHWKTLYGNQIFDFDYDAFVLNPRTSIERLVAFCGLEWDSRCAPDAAAGVGGAVKTASVWQVRQPVYRSSSGRWRNYARQLEPLREYLGDLAGD